MSPAFTNHCRKPGAVFMRWIAVLALIVILSVVFSQGLISPTSAVNAFAPTATATPLPAGSPNQDWTPIVEEFNGVPFVYVPAGCFMMGSTDAQVDAAFQQCEAAYGTGQCQKSWFEAEKPQHEICLSAYWIGQTEVTNAQYKQCVDAGACTPPGNRTAYDDPAYANHPVVYVDWDQASAYARWSGGSLPTEAQWEYAARGPESWVYPWGNTFEGTRLNFCDTNCEFKWHNQNVNDGYARTAPVGTYPGGASWVGALDMSGNVWEWVSTRYKAYPYDAADGRESNIYTSNSRVVRGGSWVSDLAVIFRASYRFGMQPYTGYGDYGFRCARSAEG